MRSYHRHYKFGMTVEDYDRLLAEQGGVCAICGGLPSRTKHLHVDHCHETNRLRGLLCDACNLGLGKFKDAYPHELSGGMKQRVALARALAQDADVLLMDEPFGALDAITRDLLHEELERIWRETRLTILFVTHNAREAVRLGDRVLVFTSRPGRVAHEVKVDLPRPRHLDSPDLAVIAGRITERLKQEVLA